MSLVAGLRFDHDLGRHVRLSVGASTLTTGEFVTQRVVFAPVSVSGVWPMSRRWSAEAGVGVILAGGWDTGDSAVLGGGLVVEPDPTFKLRALRPMPTAGVRYAAGPLQVRGGVAVHSTRVGQPERTWVLPWPTVSAGVRF